MRNLENFLLILIIFIIVLSMLISNIINIEDDISLSFYRVEIGHI